MTKFRIGELIYQLLKALDVTITKDIAQNILTSIIVETSSFRLPDETAFKPGQVFSSVGRRRLWII